MYSTYFIGVPTGRGQEHLTLKFLGQLDDVSANTWVRKLDTLATVEKFPLKAEGLGMLGLHKPHLVNFLKVNPRMETALGLLGNTVNTQPPHVTVHGLGKAGQMPINTGAVPLMSEVTASEVHLYKADASRNYAPVHTVRFKNRTPLTWVKDKLGLDKYAGYEDETTMLNDLEFHKTAVSAAAIEMSLGGALGGYYGGKALRKIDDAEDKTVSTLSGAIIGATAGAAGFSYVGDKVRSLGIRKANALKNIAAKLREKARK